MMNNIKVIGLGALNIDHIYKVGRILDDGEAVVEEAGYFPGGSAANTIYGLARLGIGTGFTGAVGDNDEGRLIIDNFKKVGVNISQISVKQGVKTGSTLCLSDRSGKRSIYVIPGANSLLSDDDLDPAHINRVSLLHLSSFVDDSQFRLSLELVNRLTPSVRLSFSPGELYVARGLKALAPILARTDILFINRNEVQKLTGEDFNKGAEACRQQGCRVVVVTLSKGKGLTGDKASSAVCYIRDAGIEYLVKPANRAETIAVDTTGAGDAFAAGFLYGLLNDRGLEECGRLGDIIAQFKISKIGARQGLPTPTRLAQKYADLYKEHL
ncbi:MAG: carbohydrate kinase family protein [Dehalococcoidales bacterium]|nr:carbohydrate kinase family protein [Dehalococcoidales bacterium]